MTVNHDPGTRRAAQAVPQGHLRYAGAAPIDLHSLSRPDIQGRRAGIISRSIAGTLDAGAVVAVLVATYAGVAAVKFLWSPRSFHFPQTTLAVAIIVGAAVVFVYFTLAWRLVGRTLGDEVLGLRVVGPGGTRMSWALSAVRAALCVCFPLALAWVVVSPQNRSLQDVLLRTSVIYDWPVRF